MLQLNNNLNLNNLKLPQFYFEITVVFLEEIDGSENM